MPGPPSGLHCPAQQQIQERKLSATCYLHAHKSCRGPRTQHGPSAKSPQSLRITLGESTRKAFLLHFWPGHQETPHHHIHPFRCDEQKSITTMPEALSVDFSGKSSNRTSSTTLSSDESCAGHVVEYSDLAIHSPTRGPKVPRNLEAHSNAQWRHMSSRYFGISLNIHRGARHDVKPSRHADEVHAKELK